MVTTTTTECRDACLSSGTAIKKTAKKSASVLYGEAVTDTLSGFIEEAAKAIANGRRIRLLGQNSKLKKIAGVPGLGWSITGLALAPADIGGHEACAWRTDGCTGACNGMFSGGNNMPGTRRAMIERKIFFFNHRQEFFAQLCEELTRFVRRCAREGLRPACRLNVSTDIVFERLLPKLFDLFPEIQFFDYTKASPRNRAELPANYHLSHSVSEKTTYSDIAEVVAAGRNIVTAFNSAYIWGSVNKKGDLPARLRVVDRDGLRPDIVLRCRHGDRHDLRLPLADGRGNCVALRGKGGRALVSEAVTAGFIVDFPGGQTARDCDRMRGEAVIVR